MNYPHKNNRRDRQSLKPILIALSVFVFSALTYFFWPQFLNQVLATVARPIWEVEGSTLASLENIITLIKSKEALLDENSRLKLEIDSARNNMIGFERLKDENIELKKLLGRTEKGEKVLSAILAKPNRTIYDTLILDVGQNGAIKKGDYVMDSGFIIGTIEEVYAETSKASLFSTAGNVFPVLIGKNNIEAEALGRGGGNFTVKLARAESVQNGDLIIQPGINPKFFGSILNIESKITDSFQTLHFVLPVNVNQIHWVIILKK